MEQYIKERERENFTFAHSALLLLFCVLYKCASYRDI